jgi:hypothetical protein
MAYDANPTGIFPGYSTNEGGSAVFDVNTLPTCSGTPNNLNDLKEILYSLLEVTASDYATLPAYESGVDVRTKAKNFSISSSVSPGAGEQVTKRFTVNFTMNSPIVDVADEPEYNPD